MRTRALVLCCLLFLAACSTRSDAPGTSPSTSAVVLPTFATSGPTPAPTSPVPTLPTVTAVTPTAPPVTSPPTVVVVPTIEEPTTVPAGRQTIPATSAATTTSTTEVMPPPPTPAASTTSSTSSTTLPPTTPPTVPATEPPTTTTTTSTTTTTTTTTTALPPATTTPPTTPPTPPTVPATEPPTTTTTTSTTTTTLPTTTPPTPPTTPPTEPSTTTTSTTTTLPPTTTTTSTSTSTTEPAPTTPATEAPTTTTSTTRSTTTTTTLPPTTTSTTEPPTTTTQPAPTTPPTQAPTTTTTELPTTTSTTEPPPPTIAPTTTTEPPTTTTTTTTTTTSTTEPAPTTTLPPTTTTSTTKPRPTTTTTSTTKPRPTTTTTKPRPTTTTTTKPRPTTTTTTKPRPTTTTTSTTKPRPTTTTVPGLVSPFRPACVAVVSKTAPFTFRDEGALDRVQALATSPLDVTMPASVGVPAGKAGIPTVRAVRVPGGILVAASAGPGQKFDGSALAVVEASGRVRWSTCPTQPVRSLLVADGGATPPNALAMVAGSGDKAAALQVVSLADGSAAGDLTGKVRAVTGVGADQLLVAATDGTTVLLAPAAGAAKAGSKLAAVDLRTMRVTALSLPGLAAGRPYARLGLSYTESGVLVLSGTAPKPVAAVLAKGAWSSNAGVIEATGGPLVAFAPKTSLLTRYAGSGKPMWQRADLRAVAKAAFQVAATGDVIIANVCVGKGADGCTPALVGLDAATGKTRWSLAGTRQVVAVRDGMVLASDGDGWTLFTAASGTPARANQHWKGTGVFVAVADATHRTTRSGGVFVTVSQSRVRAYFPLVAGTKAVKIALFS